MSRFNESHVQFKAAASVADTARLVGLSRERFYQLMKTGFFPSPVYNLCTRRPLYLEAQQRECVEARRRNLGQNGQVVLFYARGPAPSRAQRQSSKESSLKTSTSAAGTDLWVLDGVRGLGLTGATDANVRAAIAQCHPQGIAGIERGVVLRNVFLALKRQNRTDRVSG